MKRSLAALSVFTLIILVAACATTAPANVQGTVSKIEGNVVTITPASGQPATVNVSRGTRFAWFSGEEAGRSDLIVGHRVSVWLDAGTQNASRLVIER